MVLQMVSWENSVGEQMEGKKSMRKLEIKRINGVGEVRGAAKT